MHPVTSKIHLREGSCKRGESGTQVSHRRFVEADARACLTCARICDCTACYGLARDFGTLNHKEIA